MAGCFIALRREPSLFFYYYFQFLLLSLLTPCPEYLIKLSTGSPPSPPSDSSGVSRSYR